MLRRIHVKGFKSLVDVEVDMAPLVVVLGANAAGKSNFLESLMLLSRVVTQRTLADAFDDPIRGYPIEAFSLPHQGLTGLLALPKAELTIEADLATPDSESLRYRFATRIRPQTGSLELIDEYLVRLGRDNQPKMSPRIEHEPPSNATGDSKKPRLMVRHLGRQGRSHFIELPLNHTLTSNLQYSGRNRYPDFDRLRSELSDWRNYYLDPRDAMRSPQPPRETDDIGTRGELIAPFLHKLNEDSGLKPHFRAIRRALGHAIPTIENLQVALDRQRATLDFGITEAGTPYSSRVISEGTLRVLALCSIAASPNPGRLITFEEPETGVHPRRIEVIAELLDHIVGNGRTQLVVSTHSPTLVAAMAERRMTDPERILLLRCHQEGRQTHLTPFDPLPLFRDGEIRDALTSPDDSRLIEALYVRGWLDA